MSHATKTQASSPRKIQVPDMPGNGVYCGVWGGSLVRFFVGDVIYEATTADYIPTLATICSVTVDGGKITVDIP